MKAVLIDEGASKVNYDLVAPWPASQGTHEQSDVQMFGYGSKAITLDGRVYMYGHGKTALLGGFGAAGYFPVSKHITYAVLAAAAVVGDNKLTVTFPSSCGYSSLGFAADELVGAPIVIGHNSANVENFVIVGNDAIGATTSTTKILVDQPVGIAHPVTDGAEAYVNPYRYLGKGALEYNAFLGVPSRNVTIAYDAWIQTWGPAWVCPGGGDATPGNTVNDRTAFFVGDGSVNFGTALTIENGYQKAGWCMDTTSSAVSAIPMIFLEISR